MNRQAFAYGILLTFLTLSAHSKSAFGQGKLGRVREAVRHSSPNSGPRRKPDPKEETREETRENRKPRETALCENDRGSRNQCARKASQRRPPNRRAGPSLFIGASSDFVPPPVQEVHLQHRVSRQIVAQPILAPQPVYQPLATPVEAPIVEVASPEADYFSQHTSRFDWGVRLSAIGGTDFDDIAFGRLDLLLQIPNGIGIETSVTMLRESGVNYRDRLNLGEVNFLYEPISHDHFRMRFGIGVNWLGDAHGGDAGFNMTSGFDWQFTEGTRVTGEIDLGNIGETDIAHLQIGVGRAISQTTEWTVGYDHLDIGGVTIGSAFTGLRFRF